MTPEFRAQLTRILAAYYGIPLDRTDQPGTFLHPAGPDEWDGWLVLTPVGMAVGIDVLDAILDSVNAVRAAHPKEHTLTGADFVAATSRSRT